MPPESVALEAGDVSIDAEDMLFDVEDMLLNVQDMLLGIQEVLLDDQEVSAGAPTFRPGDAFITVAILELGPIAASVTLPKKYDRSLL